MFPHVSTEAVREMARRLGRQVARNFPGLDPDDIASEAIAYLTDWTKDGADPTEDYVFGILKKAAYKHANEERYDYMINSSQFVYTPREVRAVLSVFFDPAAWDVPTQKDDYLTATITGGTVGASLLDVKSAMEKLTDGQRHLLVRAFEKEEKLDDTKALSRAVDALTKHLNRHVNRGSFEHEGPGASRSVSSAAGQQLVKQANEGDGSGFERDALDDLQRELAGRRSDPPGTHFKW